MSERRIVVGVDFSDASRRALEAATELARDLGASLILVHAFSRFPRVAGPRDQESDPVSEVQKEINVEEAVELTTKWAAKVRSAGVRVETVASDKAPDDAILEAAEQHFALLIVVGTHGRTGLKRLVMGSVADAVMRQSSRPVLVVPS